MKRTIFIVLATIVLIAVAILAAPVAPPSTVTLGFNAVLDPTVMGGMTPNDYSTNFAFELRSSPDCTIPTNSWPIVALWPASQFTNQGVFGSEWTNQVQATSNPTFYLLRITAYGGSAGPFSGIATWVQRGPPGAIWPRK